MTNSPPRPETIERLANGVFQSAAMLAGMKLEVFTPLGDGPRTADEVAEAIGVGSAKLGPLLYALVVAGLLTNDGEHFANTAEADHFLVKGKPSYVGSRYAYYEARWSEVLQTAESIQTGFAQAKLDFTQISQDDMERFLRGLHPETMATGRTLASRYDFAGRRQLLDVGGGSGGVAIAMTEALPDLHATVVDLPTVTQVTQRFLDEAGASGRVSVVAADVVSGPLAGPFDVAVMRAFIQVLSPEEAQSAIKKVADVLEPGGELYILGTGIVDDSRVSPPESVLFNLVFVNVYDGGEAYTEQQYRDWLDEAGLVDFQRVTLPNGSGIISARKPG